MTRREIIHIDEEKCDGCGQCVPACEEGAIRMVNGKAKIIAETYCDGLGACLGHCPQGALSVITRQAQPFDPEAVKQHVGNHLSTEPPQQGGSVCPGTAAMNLSQAPAGSSPTAGPGLAQQRDEAASVTRSALSHWPIQLQLVPPDAQFLSEADLLLTADCVPFACADFHQRFLPGRKVVVGCPKLDPSQQHVQKLAAIVQVAKLKSITVLRMEVPCCAGLETIARSAVERAQANVPVHTVVISRQGEVLGQPGFGMAKLCKQSTTPTDTNIQPSHLGGLTVLL